MSHRSKEFAGIVKMEAPSYTEQLISRMLNPGDQNSQCSHSVRWSQNICLETLQSAENTKEEEQKNEKDSIRLTERSDLQGKSISENHRGIHMMVAQKHNESKNARIFTHEVQ